MAKYFFCRSVAPPCKKVIFAFERNYIAVRKSVLDMPVPGSFWNIRYEGLWLCETMWLKLNENRRSSLKIRWHTWSHNASNVDEKWSKNHDVLIRPYRVIASSFSWTLHCNNSVRMYPIITIFYQHSMHYQTVSADFNLASSIFTSYGFTCSLSPVGLRFEVRSIANALFPYSRHRSLGVVDRSQRSFAVIGVSGSLGITASRWRSFRVVDSLSWSLMVFQSLHLNCYFWRQTYSLPVADGLSQSLEYLGRWESLPAVGGLSGSLTVFHGR